MNAFASHFLWKKYVIVDDILVKLTLLLVVKVSKLTRHSSIIIQPFTAGFPHANIHELLAPDILHQIIKGTFKDHLVAWVEAYLKKHYKNNFEAVMADNDYWYVKIDTLV